MFFVTAKIAWIILSPLNLIVLLQAAGLLIAVRAGGAGRRLIGAGALLLVPLAILPIGENGFRWLERRIAVPTALPQRVDGILVLGGVIDRPRTRRSGRAVLNYDGERIAAFIDLARRYPTARLVFSGGSGDLFDQMLSEAAVMQPYFAERGLPPERFTFESASRNTVENARFSQALVRPAAGEVWLLVTSAWHMPRSVAIFARLGWPVVPVPVDHKLDPDYRWLPAEFDALRSFHLLNLVTRELVGMVAYRAAGHTDRWLPGAAGGPAAPATGPPGE